jgi:hypothetical protein
VDRQSTPTRAAGPGHLAILVAAGLLASLYLSWRALAAADFIYPLLYDAIGIGQHIDIYAPQNRYKRNFELTSPEERQALFAAIGEAVRDRGQGLEGLTYRDPQGRQLGVLLRAAEVIHLRDVARLVRIMEIAGLLSLALVSFHLVLLRQLRLSLPAAGRLLAYTATGILALAVIVIAIGPVEVFYAFHRWIFPADHEWFFYYQDSLMSTLMMAPDLFGYIAVALVLLALAFLWAIFWITSRATRA